MWWTVAAAALPYIIGAMQKKPKSPPPPSQVVLPDRSAYMNQILQDGFNTNSTMYHNASDQVQEQVNRALARQGLVGSSGGAQAMVDSQNKVAQTFIDEKLRREQAAMGVVQGYDMGKAGIDQNNSAALAAYNAASYQSALARQAAVVQGVGSVAGAAANAYGAQENRDYWANRGYGPRSTAPYQSMSSYNPAPISYASSAYGAMSSPAPTSSMYGGAAYDTQPFYNYGQTPGYGGIPVSSNPAIGWGPGGYEHY